MPDASPYYGPRSTSPHSCSTGPALWEFFRKSAVLQGKRPWRTGKRWPKYRYCFSCLKVRGGSLPGVYLLILCIPGLAFIPSQRYCFRKHTGWDMLTLTSQGSSLMSSCFGELNLCTIDEEDDQKLELAALIFEDSCYDLGLSKGQQSFAQGSGCISQCLPGTSQNADILFGVKPPQAGQNP